MPGASSVTHVKCRWDSGMQIFYDAATNETVHVNAPYYFYDDFVGHAGLEVGDTAETWDIVDVSAAGDTTPAILPGTAASGAIGVVRLQIENNDEAEDSVLYWGDQTPVQLYNDTQFECRLAVHGTVGTGVCAVWGMCGAHNLDKDTIAESAWFRLDASNVLTIETDDTTNDTSTTAAITLVTDVYHNFRVNFANMSDVKFYMDGVQMAPATTFDMSNLTAAEAMVQPYFSLDKASGTGTGTLYIDSCQMWSARGSYVDDT